MKDIRNPVVSKILRESTKQTAVVIRGYGVPDAVHLEMARDIGKSREERQEIEDAQKERAAERDKHRRDLMERLDLAREPSHEELLRCEPWLEPNHRCPYTASTDRGSCIRLE